MNSRADLVHLDNDPQGVRVDTFDPFAKVHTTTFTYTAKFAPTGKEGIT